MTPSLTPLNFQEIHGVKFIYLLKQLQTNMSALICYMIIIRNEFNKKKVAKEGRNIYFMEY